MTRLSNPAHYQGDPDSHHTRHCTIPRSSPSGNCHHKQTSPTTGDQPSYYPKPMEVNNQACSPKFERSFPENDVQKSTLISVVLYMWSRSPSKLMVSWPIQCVRYPHSYPIPGYQSTNILRISLYSYPIPKSQNINSYRYTFTIFQLSNHKANQAWESGESILDQCEVYILNQLIHSDSIYHFTYQLPLENSSRTSHLYHLFIFKHFSMYPWCIQAA